MADFPGVFRPRAREPDRICGPAHDGLPRCAERSLARRFWLGADRGLVPAGGHRAGASFWGGAPPPRNPLSLGFSMPRSDWPRCFGLCRHWRIVLAASSGALLPTPKPSLPRFLNASLELAEMLWLVQAPEDCAGRELRGAAPHPETLSPSVSQCLARIGRDALACAGTGGLCWPRAPLARPLPSQTPRLHAVLVSKLVARGWEGRSPVLNATRLLLIDRGSPLRAALWKPRPSGADEIETTSRVRACCSAIKPVWGRPARAIAPPRRALADRVEHGGRARRLGGEGAGQRSPRLPPFSSFRSVPSIRMGADLQLIGFT